MAKRIQGSRCCFFGCNVSSSICRGLSFHAIPKVGASAEQDAWRARLLYLASRADANFNPNTAKVCSRHFTDDCFEYHKNQSSINFRGRRLKFGAEPTLFLPKKFASVPNYRRKTPADRGRSQEENDVKDEGSSQGDDLAANYTYDNLASLQQDLCNVQAPWCVIVNSSDVVKIAVINKGNVEKEVTVTCDEENRLQASVQVYGIPVSHLTTNFVNECLLFYLQDLQNRYICVGITDSYFQELVPLSDGTGTKLCYRHVVNDLTADGRFFQKSCVRSRECEILVPATESETIYECRHCLSKAKSLQKRFEKRETRDISSPYDPLHGVSLKAMKAAFKNQRAANNKQSHEFRERIERESVHLSPQMHKDLLCGIDASQIEDPLASLFWEEQLKAFQTKDRGFRWHPMMIRLAILLHSKCPSAYNILRKTGVLKLPGTSTLQEYTKAVKPSEGFQLHVQNELKKRADELEEHKHFVCLLHDEMSIKSDLVFDKETGELIGFVKTDQGTSFDLQGNMLATQALVFLPGWYQFRH